MDLACSCYKTFKCFAHLLHSHIANIYTTTGTEEDKEIDQTLNIIWDKRAGILMYYQIYCTLRCYSTSSGKLGDSLQTE